MQIHSFFSYLSHIVGGNIAITWIMWILTYRSSTSIQSPCFYPSSRIDGISSINNFNWIPVEPSSLRWVSSSVWVIHISVYRPLKIDPLSTGVPFPSEHLLKDEKVCERAMKRTSLSQKKNSFEVVKLSS